MLKQRCIVNDFLFKDMLSWTQRRQDAGGCPYNQEPHQVAIKLHEINGIAVLSESRGSYNPSSKSEYYLSLAVSEAGYDMFVRFVENLTYVNILRVDDVARLKITFRTLTHQMNWLVNKECDLVPYNGIVISRDVDDESDIISTTSMLLEAINRITKEQ